VLALLLAARAGSAAPKAAAEIDVYTALRAPIGSDRTDFVLPDDTLLDVAARNHLGFEAVSRLNPGLDPWIPDPGTVVRLPTRYLLPQAAPAGLVMNIPEMRLYDYTVEEGPEVFAVAIGDADDPTPVGEFRVGHKRVDPEWRVPASIRAVKPDLPAIVPPGPDNPLGSRWMTIGSSSYGLHGTNVRWSIGRIATHGCVRFYEDDIVRLYNRVREGTRLQLVYQPYKWGRDGNQLLLEAHPDVYGRIPEPLEAALEMPRALGFAERVDIAAVRRVIERADGVPTVVGTLPPQEIAPTESLLRDPLLEDRLGLASRVRGVLSGAARVRRGLLGGGGAALGVARSGFDSRDALVERIEPAVDLLHVTIGRAARQREHQHGARAGENSSSHRNLLLG
jgi:L,D-transpeptidase ErfK/SrfK